MGFFKGLKGDHPDTVGQSSSDPQHTANDMSETYAPPPGPPPSHRPQQVQAQYAPPPGPPPGREQYPPPPCPPPSHQWNNAVVPNSSPASARNQSKNGPPPYHDWTIIPDNALLPPPPSIGQLTSPSGNANLSEADRAHEWCKTHPIMGPHQPTYAQHIAVANGDVRLIKAREYNGDFLMANTGFWKGSTRSGTKDSCLLSSSPLYFAAADAPMGIAKTIYYELKVRSLGRGRDTDESSIALGYCVMPYPTWRMPGWERGSLAVHGDDGRRYVNNTWGGKDFTSPFQVGDTLGLGMSFSIPESPPQYGSTQEYSNNVEVFLTRNGEKGESWNLHEELDAENDLGVEGLDGRFDLYAAVGTFGGVEFDVLFSRQDWLWRPR